MDIFKHFNINPISIVVSIITFILVFYLVYIYLTKDLSKNEKPGISIYVYSILISLTLSGISGYFYNKFYPGKKELLRGDFFKY